MSNSNTLDLQYAELSKFVGTSRGNRTVRSLAQMSRDNGINPKADREWARGEIKRLRTSGELNNGIRYSDAAIDNAPRTNTTSNPTPKESKSMNNKSSSTAIVTLSNAKSAALDTGSMLMHAGEKALKVRAAVSASNIALHRVEALVGAAYPALLRTPAGKHAAEILFPSIVYMICSYLAAGSPKAAKVKSLIEPAVEGTASDAMASALAFFEPFVEGLLADLTGGVAEIESGTDSES